MTQTAVFRPSRATLAALVGVVLFGGVNAIGVRQTVLELSPFWGAAIRFLAAGMILAVFVQVTRRPFPRGRGLAGAALYGLIGFGGSFGLVYPALRDVSASTAQVLIALTPLFTFGLAIVHGQERFRLHGLAGALIAVAGVAVVFADRLAADVPLGSLVLILLGAACIAEAGVIVKWIPRGDAFATNAVAMGTGGLLLLILSLLTGEVRALPEQLATWVSIAYLIVLGSVVMFGLYLYALQRWTASAVSYTTLLLPFVTVPLAAVLTGEQVTPALAAGGAITVVGVYVGAFLRIRPNRSSASSMPECLPIDACSEPPSARRSPRPA